MTCILFSRNPHWECQIQMCNAYSRHNHLVEAPYYGCVANDTGITILIIIIVILTFVLVSMRHTDRSVLNLSIIHPQTLHLTTQLRAQRCATKSPKPISPSCSPERIRRGANTRPSAGPKTSRRCCQASERLPASSAPTSLSKHSTTKSPPPTLKSQPPQPNPPTRE